MTVCDRCADDCFRGGGPYGVCYEDPSRQAFYCAKLRSELTYRRFRWYKLKMKGERKKE